MRLPDHERAAHREAFRTMTLPEKADYIFAYYKLPLVLALVVMVALGWVVLRRITHKEPLLYVALVNVADSEALDNGLGNDYVIATGNDPRTAEVYCYHALYLSDPEGSSDHQYSYASRMKLMGAVAAEQLDVVIMNRDGYDLLSNSGYLMDLAPFLAEGGDGTAALAPLLQTNVVVDSDNSIEVELNEADAYVAETHEEQNALEVSGRGLFSDFSEPVYLGIIGNSPRADEALAYLAYLVEG